MSGLTARCGSRLVTGVTPPRCMADLDQGRWWGPQAIRGSTAPTWHRAGPWRRESPAGQRRSPHHRCPILWSGRSVVKERRDSSVLRIRGAALIGRRGSRRGGPVPSSWALRDRGTQNAETEQGRSERKTRCRRRMGPATRGSGQAHPQADTTAGRACRRACQRASSNGWPDCITRSRSGTIFRAMAHTAFVFKPPFRASSAR